MPLAGGGRHAADVRDPRGALLAALGIAIVAIDRKHRKAGFALAAFGLLLAGAVAAVVVLAANSRM